MSGWADSPRPIFTLPEPRTVNTTDTFTLLPGRTPLLVSLPHIGTFIPEALRPAYTERALAVEDTDWHLDALYDFAREMGAGLLMLFRHRASLGGINVVALFLQERLGWRAGQVQMVLDVLILLAAFGVTDPWRVALSVLGAVVLNLALAINHRPGRYMAV